MADNLTSLLAQAEALTAQAVAQCAAQLRALPGNPAANSLSDTPRAFVMSSSAMFGNSGGRWDVFFHDWPSQYDEVAKLLESRNFAKVRELLTGERVELARQGRTSLAPQVIENIRAVTGNLLLTPEEAAKKAA